MLANVQVPSRPKRNFIPEDFEVKNWESLAPFFSDLENREIKSSGDLEKWLLDRTEIDAILEEDFAFRYIRMNIDTNDKALADRFNLFVTDIQPKLAPISDTLNKKCYNSDFFKDLDEEEYKIFIRSLKTQIELFREENIPLHTKLQQDEQKFGGITGKLSIEHDGQELTLPQAGKFLKSTDRALRKEIFEKVGEKRLSVKEDLQNLLSELLETRLEVAKNTGYKNYLEYKFDAMERFDYTIEDCENFHDAVQKTVVPLIKDLQLERKASLGLDTLRPYDMAVDPSGKEALKPFDGDEQLIEKSVECLAKLNPFFGECIAIMNKMGHLDLVSKKGKAPGGFNYPLYEIGVPFIYMNAVGTQRDVVVMLHEAGHAIHSFLSRDLKLNEFKSVTSEVAELASMSMELISMDAWDVFYDSEDELKRAKKDQLAGVIETLPWIAIVDKFQHWLYTNIGHSHEERLAAWKSIITEFGTGVVNHSGYEDGLLYGWQKQLHIFEVPLYYIEYGMAQLGAVAMWKNYKENPEHTIEQYKAALKLGYTKTIGEIYETAGIKFDFSADYIKELMDFVKAEYDAL